MKSGVLRHKITLQRPTVTDDAYGQQIVSWQDVATVLAGDEPLSLRGTANVREVVAGGEQANISWRWITIRARADIRNDWRVKFVGGRRDGMTGDIFDVRDGNVLDEMNLVVRLLNG